MRPPGRADRTIKSPSPTRIPAPARPSERSGLVEACARVGLIVRPFRVGVRVSVGSREQNDRFLSVAVEFARTAGIGA